VSIFFHPAPFFRSGRKRLKTPVNLCIFFQHVVIANPDKGTGPCEDHAEQPGRIDPIQIPDWRKGKGK
jgi:hypothetical protein